MAAYRPVGRTRNIMRTGLERRYQFAQPIVDGLWRESLVATAENPERSMIADAQKVVLRICEEQFVIVRVGTIPGIGKPEILPNYHAIAVRRIVESLIVGLPNPIADHVEVFVAVI